MEKVKEMKKSKVKTYVSAAQKLQNFLEKENIQLTPVPQWRPRDDGTFSLVVALNVGDRKNE